MANDYSVDDLLDFLQHAGDRGLMPAATSTALAVAVRNVFSVLGEGEGRDLREVDLEAVIRRFTNKRAKDFNPSSLKEYGRRTRRAVDLYTQWRDNPADFTVKTRAPAAPKKKSQQSDPTPLEPAGNQDEDRMPVSRAGGYQSAFPVRAGRVITLYNIPEDLTGAEADRLAQFVKMLAVD